MRLNIYSSDRPSSVATTGRRQLDGETYLGGRIEFNKGESAVTFWTPAENRERRIELAGALRGLAELLESGEARTYRAVGKGN